MAYVPEKPQILNNINLTSLNNLKNNIGVPSLDNIKNNMPNVPSFNHIASSTQQALPRIQFNFFNRGQTNAVADGSQSEMSSIGDMDDEVADIRMPTRNKQQRDNNLNVVGQRVSDSLQSQLQASPMPAVSSNYQTSANVSLFNKQNKASAIGKVSKNDMQ